MSAIISQYLQHRFQPLEGDLFVTIFLIIMLAKPRDNLPPVKPDSSWRPPVSRGDRIGHVPDSSFRRIRKQDTKEKRVEHEIATCPENRTRKRWKKTAGFVLSQFFAFLFVICKEAIG